MCGVCCYLSSQPTISLFSLLWGQKNVASLHRIHRRTRAEHGSGHEMKYAFLYHRGVPEGILIPLNEMTKVLICNITTDRLVADIHPHTELCVDLKLLTREPGRLNIGATLGGIITRDGEEHYTFLEEGDQQKASSQRNPHVYRGRFVNVNQSGDGTLYPTFNRPRYTKEFSFQDLCREAAAELLMVAGLVGKKGSKK